MKKVTMSVRVRAPRKTNGAEAPSEGKEGDKMDWKPKGGNRPTDHDLEVAIFEAP